MLVPPTTYALPAVKSLEECADFSLTVSPYIPQLFTFPQRLLEAIPDAEALKNVYLSTNPIVTGFAFCLFIVPIFLIVSEVNKNYSQVDRVWSILPTVYHAHYALWTHLAGLPTERIDTVLAFSCIWSLRLTFNYWRRGGYSIGAEDYRWEVVRRFLNNPVLMFILNVVFISLIQSILLFSITTPTYVLLLAAQASGQHEMSPADLIFSRLQIALVLFEYFADQQQWRFQQAKKQYQQNAKVPPRFTREELDRGFVHTGLWAYSRHPNFLAEQAIWFTLYQWSCYETNSLFNWTVAGAMSYLALFQGSTWLTESITASKYPEYKDYQRTVGKFLPNFFSGGFKGSQIKDGSKGTGEVKKSGEGNRTAEKRK